LAGATSYALNVGTVVGRDSELAAADSFLAARGGFAGLAIVGEPGIGKTTLWDEVMRRAQEGGALVLVARPSEAEAKLSFAALSDLVSALDARAFEALPEPQRQALDVALLRHGTSCRRGGTHPVRAHSRNRTVAVAASGKEMTMTPTSKPLKALAGGRAAKAIEGNL
jgi:Cdc6-like AAA superfamily ATPase